MLLDATRRFFEKTGGFFRAVLSRVAPLRSQKACATADYYSIVSPVSMVRVGRGSHAQGMHLLVYGRIDPPHSGIRVQVAFQGHQLDLDSVDSVQAPPVITLTDRTGEFVVDESFNCGPYVEFLTSVTSLPDIETPPVIASLHLKKEEEKEGTCCEKCDVRQSRKPLPTATITIDFESHCQRSVTYWFENPYKKGTISRTTEISYCPTESSALYLKLYPHKKKHTSIVDIFTTTEEHPIPRYQRVHTRKNDEEFTRIAIFDSDSPLKSALILV